jgi:hypothetical protein
VEKKRIIGIERSVLQIIGFDFNLQLPYRYLLKYGKRMNVDREYVLQAWDMCIQSFRQSAVCIQFPPHMIACACLYLCTVNALPHGWWTQYVTRTCDVYAISRQLVDALSLDPSLLTSVRSAMVDEETLRPAKRPRLTTLLSGEQGQLRFVFHAT